MVLNVSTPLTRPTLFAYTNMFFPLPISDTQSTLLSNSLEGDIFSRENISYIGRSTQSIYQPYSLIQSTYVPDQNTWFQTNLSDPVFLNPSNSGLKWIQDALGTIWILVNRLGKGTAGNGSPSQLLTIQPNSILTLYNGTQYTFLDIQLYPFGMYMLAMFSGQSPVSLVTYGIVTIPRETPTNFTWVPGTQRTNPIQAFCFSQDRSGLYIASSNLEIWVLNSTSRWSMNRTIPFTIPGPIVALQTGFQPNTLYCISAKVLLMIMLRGEAVIQSVLTSLGSGVSFRSIGIGMIQPSYFMSPSATATAMATLSADISSSTASSSSTSSATSSATYSAMYDATSSATHSAMYDATSSATYSAMYDATSSATATPNQSGTATASDTPSSTPSHVNTTGPNIYSSTNDIALPIGISMSLLGALGLGVLFYQYRFTKGKLFKQNTPKQKPTNIYKNPVPIQLGYNPQLKLSFEPLPHPSTMHTQPLKKKVGYQPTAVQLVEYQ